MSRKRIEEKEMNEQKNQRKGPLIDEAFTEESFIEGRNAVIEALRAGRAMEKLYIQDGIQDGPVQTIKREARKREIVIKYVTKQRLDQMTATGRHQGVIAVGAAYEYGTVEDMLRLAEEKGEAPFLFLLDNIEDPHNLGAIIRTANLCGAHGVIIPKNRAAHLTAVVARASAGASPPTTPGKPALFSGPRATPPAKGFPTTRCRWGWSPGGGGPGGPFSAFRGDRERGGWGKGVGFGGCRVL